MMPTSYENVQKLQLKPNKNLMWLYINKLYKNPNYFKHIITLKPSSYNNISVVSSLYAISKFCSNERKITNVNYN